MEWKTADVLYNYVVSDAQIDPRLKRSFERIKLVCDDLITEAKAQIKRGTVFSSSPIYVAEVGRRCKERFGGPSAESITRNRRTEPLKATYIQLRADELDVPGLRRKEGKSEGPLGDPSVRAYIQALEARIKASEEIIVGLTGSMKKMSPISLNEALATTSDDGDQLEIAAGLRNVFSHHDLVASIRRLLDAEHLVRFGLKKERSIFNPATGEELLTVAEVELFQAIVGSERPGGEQGRR
ncbi:hypothetical protein H4W19_14660 [Pseudoxanthomonas mexicana]|uniref:Uncharacterized protein n=1 Tax=Pseudoxanthomonas mexicana TaxID=128785 RepID=A0ABX6RAQ9_PSEMX|nr:hypothetical protein [Pseudoxanthomonas mexicana]QND79573.1 hypothetical protein H4W19_14660 [Pseudoxanthomonas mexicana]